MAQKFLTSIDLVGNQICGVRLENLATDPTNKGGGHLFYNSTDKVAKLYNGTAFKALAFAGDDVALSSLVLGSAFAGKTGFLKRGASGWEFDTNTYLTQNQSISLTGDVTGSGGTSIATTMANGAVTNAKLANSSLTIGSTSISLGGTTTRLAGLVSIGFTAQSSVSTTAHLEVVTIGGKQYLHTSLPFFSDKSVSSGGMSDTSGGGSSVDVLGITAVRALQSEDLTKVPSAYALKTVDARFSNYYTKETIDTKLSSIVAEQDALVYKSTIAGGSTGAYGTLTPAAERGHLYKVSAAGKINGVEVEVGDMLICNADTTAAATSSNYNTIKANWDYIQTNITNYVSSLTIGSTSKSGAITLYSGGTTNGNINFSWDGTTVKAAVYGIAAAAYKGVVTSVTADTTSTNLPTAKSIVEFVKGYSGNAKSYDISGATLTEYTTTTNFTTQNLVAVLYDKSNNVVITDTSIVTSNGKYNVKVKFASAIGSETYRLVVIGV